MNGTALKTFKSEISVVNRNNVFGRFKNNADACHIRDCFTDVRYITAACNF